MSSCTYSDTELINAIKQIFEMDISVKDLQSCKADFVQKIYSHFLLDLGASLEKLREIPFKAPASVHSYPEMYYSQSFFLGLAKCVNYYLERIYGNTDFTVTDVIKPDPNRTRRFFVMFLEFYNYISQNIFAFEEMEKESAAEKEKLMMLEESINSYKKELQRRQMENAEYQIAIDQEMKGVLAVKEEIVVAQEMKSRLKGRLEGVKIEQSSLVTQIKEEELKMLELKEAIDNLKNEVIQEGELQEIELREKRLETQVNSNKELKRKLSDLKENMQVYSEAERLLANNLLPLLDEIDKEKKEHQQLQTLQKELEKSTQHSLEENQELTRMLQMLTESINSLQEKNIHLVNTKEMKKDGLVKDIKQLMLNLEEQKRYNEEHKLVDEELSSELVKLGEDTEMIMQKQRLYLDNLVLTYKELIAKVKKVCDEENKMIMKRKLPEAGWTE